MTKENLRSYINYQIENMSSSIAWAKDRMEDYTYPFKIDWAYDQINEAKNRAFGAINFAHIWDKTITDREAEEFREMLKNGWNEQYDRVSREIVA